MCASHAVTTNLLSDKRMSIRHENNNGTGGGGGGSTEVTIISSRHTIEPEEVSNGVWDINVAGEDSIRFLVHNFKELMEAFVTVGEMYTRNDKTSCVIQLMNDIDMTSPTAEDEDLYKVNGNKLIDRANYTYNLRLYLRYTTILSDGKQRILQLLYPYDNKTKLDIWSFKSEILSIDNVGFGGTSSSWNTLHSGESPISTGRPPIFTRYLLTSDGNVTYTFKNSSFPVCGAFAENNGYNPFIYEGSGNNRPSLYHTRLEIIGCSFITGTDPGGGNIWANTYAPIVINATYMENYQRALVVERCSKAIGNNANDTGVPNIQIWSPSAQEDSPWQVTSDGTALISHQYGSSSLLLKTRLALNDLYLQGTPLTPAGNPPTENYVSLVEILEKINITFDFGASNSGQTLLCIADVTSMMTGHFQPVGIAGMLFALPPSSASGSEVALQRIIAYGSSSAYPKLRIDNDTNEGISPFVIQYSSKYYLALRRKRSESFTKVSLLGQTYGLNISPFRLYSDPAGTSWFSDEGHTQTVSLSFVRNPEAFRQYFGGDPNKVVAGDGSLLDWNSKLGYWKGTQQQYSDLPANEKDIPNVLYVII